MDKGLAYTDLLLALGTAQEDGQYIRALAIYEDKMVSIHPSSQMLYFFVEYIEARNRLMSHLRRPIHLDGIEKVLSFWGLDGSNLDWELQSCQPADVWPPGSSESYEKQNPLVYFIEGNGLIKVGVAQNPHARLRQLQHWSPVKLKLLATIEGGYKKEKELHKRFAYCRTHGEWFQPAPELLSYIEGVQCYNK